MNDPEYIKFRDPYRRSQTPEAKAEQQIPEIQEFYEYIPHDPSNIRFLDPEVRRRLP